MSQASISCNIAIIPPPAIAHKAIAASRLLRRHGGLYVLDSKKYFPHITLYMTEFPVKNIPMIKTLLRRLSLETRTLGFSSPAIRLKKDRSVVIILKSVAVRTLHRKIVRILNHLREGLMRPKDAARFDQLTTQEQCMLQRYGYKDALARYVPHLTLAKLSSAKRPAITDFISSNSVFRSRMIGLFQSGEHGTCRKLLAKFTIQA